jgi:hypothetical protein
MKRNYFNVAKVLCPVVISLLCLSSCSREPDETQLCSTNMTTLSGTYKLTAIKYKATPATAEVDYLAFMEDCEKDDLVTLNPNGTYNYKDAGTSCAPKGDESGTWSLSGNTVYSDGIVGGTIESFDCKTLVVFVTDVNIPGDKLAVTFTK